MIYIFVEGGVVTGIFGPTPDEVCIVDYDTEGNDDAPNLRTVAEESAFVTIDAMQDCHKMDSYVFTDLVAILAEEDAQAVAQFQS